jgi:hypothetical protein
LRAPSDGAVRRLLTRCHETDTHASVAETCAGQPRPDSSPSEPATVLIVPSSGGEPTPAAPYALLWPDGSLRLGSADRRGAVHEPRATHGAIEVLPYTGGE